MLYPPSPPCCNSQQAIGRIDEDGSRYLMSDYQGALYLMVLAHNGEQALGIKIEILGEGGASREGRPTLQRLLSSYFGFNLSCLGSAVMVTLHSHTTFDHSRIYHCRLSGHTSVARSLSYLDSGVVYVGSKTGDSQVGVERCSHLPLPPLAQVCGKARVGGITDESRIGWPYFHLG